MTTKSKKSGSYQHYVPQCILKHFISTDPKWAKQKAISIFCIEDNKWLKKRSISVAGGEPGLYDIEGKNTKKDADKSFFEKEFSKLERKFANIFNNKITQKKDLNKEEKDSISAFISLMFVRTPKHSNGVYSSLEVHLNEMSKMIATVTEERLHKGLPLPEGLEKYEGNREFVSEMVELAKKGVLKAIPEKHFVFSTGLINLFGHLSGIIYHMKWRFLEIVGTKKLVISDTPVVVKNFRKAKLPIFAGGNGFLSSEKVKVYFPLTPNLCFEGSWGKKDFILTFIYGNASGTPPFPKLIQELRARNVYISMNELKNIFVEHKKEGKAGYWNRKANSPSTELYGKITDGHVGKINKLSIENSYKYFFGQENFPVNIKNYKIRKKSTKVFGNIIWTGEE